MYDIPTVVGIEAVWWWVLRCGCFLYCLPKSSKKNIFIFNTIPNFKIRWHVTDSSKYTTWQQHNIRRQSAFLQSKDWSNSLITTEKSHVGKPIYKFKDRQHQRFTAVLIWSARYSKNTTQDVFIMADGFASAQCEPEKDSQLFPNIVFVMHLHRLLQIMRHKMAIRFTMNSRRLT